MLVCPRVGQLILNGMTKDHKKFRRPGKPSGIGLTQIAKKSEKSFVPAEVSGGRRP